MALAYAWAIFVSNEDLSMLRDLVDLADLSTLRDLADLSTLHDLVDMIKDMR